MFVALINVNTGFMESFYKTIGRSIARQTDRLTSTIIHFKQNHFGKVNEKSSFFSPGLY